MGPADATTAGLRGGHGLGALAAGLLLLACSAGGPSPSAVPVVEVEAVEPSLVEAAAGEEDEAEDRSGKLRRPSWVKSKTPKQEEQTRAAATAAEKMAAKGAYKQASRALRDGDLDQAVERFILAHRSYPGAAPKHKIAVCFDRLGKRKEAINAYYWFIQSEPGEKYRDRVEESKRRLAELTGKPLTKSSPPVTQLRQ
ncbi:MAG: hypothetical protein JRI68_29050 [Deltaproteobacteria bacterium]|nr:hypothetical protein [Deltaproteobacteria bacterium]